MPEPTMFRFRDRLPRDGEGKAPRNEIVTKSDGNTSAIYLYDVIDSWGGFWGTSATELRDAINALPDGTDTIHLHINSPGGEVFEAVAMKNLLAQHPANVVAVIDGLAASAASFVAVSADEVVMGDNSQLMIHDASGLAAGNAADFTQFAEMLNSVSDNIASMYAAKAGGTTAEWRDVMRGEKWYGAEDAVSAGLADRVGTPDTADEESAKNLAASRQFVAALAVIRGAGTHPDPAKPAASVAEPKEKAEQQTETAPTATAASGAGRSEEHVTPQPTPKQKEPVMPSMTVEERRARISEIDARLIEMDAAAENEKLSPAARTEWDSLEAEKVDHIESIKDIEARKARLMAQAQNPAATEDTGQVETRGTSYLNQAPGVIVKPKDIFDLTEIRNKARTVEDFGKGYRDNAMRAVETARFPGAKALGGDREKVQARLETMLQNEASEDNTDSALALRILRSGSPTYNRAFGKAFSAAARGNPDPKGGLSPAELQALTLGTDSDGGYAVPFELDPTVILTSAGSTNPMRQIARVVEITGKKWEGLTSAGSTATREGEVDEAASANPSFQQPVIDTSRVDVFIDFSIALESGWTDLSSELSMVISEALADEEATSFITGAGTGLTTGGTLPQGILTGLSATTTSYHVVGTTGSLTLGDLEDVQAALPDRFDNNTSWVATRSFYSKTEQLTTMTTLSDIAAGSLNNLLGAPKYRASGMPAYSTSSNANLAIYGNIARAFTIVDRIGFSVNLIPFMTGPNGRPNGKRGLWGYRYNGSKVIVPSAAVLLRMK